MANEATPGLLPWFASIAVTDLFISALVIGELRKGIAMSRRRQGLHHKRRTWMPGCAV